MLFNNKYIKDLAILHENIADGTRPNNLSTERA